MAEPDSRLDEEITGGQAAALLGVTRQHVNRLAHDGKLPGRHVAGRFWVFKRGDVLAYKNQPKNVGGRPKSDAISRTPLLIS